MSRPEDAAAASKCSAPPTCSAPAICSAPPTCSCSAPPTRLCSAPPTLKGADKVPIVCCTTAKPKKRPDGSPGTPAGENPAGAIRQAAPSAGPPSGHCRLRGASLWRRRGGWHAGTWHSQSASPARQPGTRPGPPAGVQAGRGSLTPVPLGHYLRPSERHPPEEAPEIQSQQGAALLTASIFIDVPG